MKYNLILYLIECPIHDFVCDSPRIGKIGEKTKNWEECGRKCENNDNCSFWHYYIRANGCYLYRYCRKQHSPGNLMGVKFCQKRK